MQVPVVRRGRGRRGKRPPGAAVCDAGKEHEKDWGRESDNYCQYSGKAFYNVTPFRLNNLGAGDTYAALDSYINGF